MRRYAIVAISAAFLLLSCASGLKRSAKDEMVLGAAAARRGYWQEALFRFERAQSKSPADAEVLNDVAVAQEALGRYDDALKTYKAALQREPHNTTIRRNYARFAEFYASYARGVKPKEGSDANP
jgi:Flp pilus assembly protein TadD